MTSKKIFVLVLPVLFLLLAEHAAAQNIAAYGSLRYPRSIISMGMGEQGGALRNTSDAMQYNPAMLAFAEHSSVSFFRYPMMSMNTRFPLAGAALSFKFANGTGAGVEYTDWDGATMPISTAEYPDGTGDYFHMYERSIAGAYAIPLGAEWAVGAQLRYAWSPLIFGGKLDHVLLSAGASYSPSALLQRMTVGLSFMNFGTPVEYPGTNIYGTTDSQPMPAQIDLAAEYAIVRQRYFDVIVALGFTKPLEKLGDGPAYTGRSSFASLFSAWTDFPEDVTTHIGLGYAWKPIPLGGGFSFFQEMYLGYFTAGSTAMKSGLPGGYATVPYTSYFTHGVRAGVEVRGVKATAGYAGRWHNNSAAVYEYASFPSETFQLTLSTDWNTADVPARRADERDHRARMILSGGYSLCVQVGRMAGEKTWGGRQEFSQTSLYSVGSDFYVDDNSAVIAALGYARMTKIFRQDPVLFYQVQPWPRETTIETLGLESGFRYHPLDAFHPFFVQASLGIMWLNPLDDYIAPRYMYTMFDRLAVGCAVPVSGTGAIVMPTVGLRTIFMENVMYRTRLGGYNELEVGLNVGYAL